MNVTSVELILLVVLVGSIVTLAIRLRIVRVSLTRSDHILDEALEKIRIQNDALVHQEAAEKLLKSERDVMRTELHGLRKEVEDLSSRLLAFQADRDQLSAELSAKSVDLERVRTMHERAWNDILEWVAQTFSSYLAEVVPENAELVEKYAERLVKSSLHSPAVEWYSKLAEACLRFGDLDRANRVSQILKELRPEDRKVAELRSRVLLRLGRILEAKWENSRGTHET